MDSKEDVKNSQNKYDRDSKCTLKVEKEYSKGFHRRTAVRQGDSLSHILFNIMIEESVNKFIETRLSVSIARFISVLAYADHILIMTES